MNRCSSDREICCQTPERFIAARFVTAFKCRRHIMKAMQAAVVIAAVLTGTTGVYAQGAATGAATGAVGGALVGGPVGAVVGATVGAVAGGIADDQRPRFRSYVTERNVPSYRYDRDLRVGADLPADGVTYYDVPREYGSTNYRYTVVNERTVLVDPKTRKVVQIID
jgi:hypothetical protein